MLTGPLQPSSCPARVQLGSRSAEAAIERQDLDEILGNLIENAAKYGGGSVFVTVDPRPGEPQCSVWVEDDGAGISESDRAKLFSRGARLDTTKPGTGLGLAIVRDVAEIYGGSVELGESEDLGGVLVRLMLPRSAHSSLSQVRQRAMSPSPSVSTVCISDIALLPLP